MLSRNKILLYLNYFLIINIIYYLLLNYLKIFIYKMNLSERFLVYIENNRNAIVDSSLYYGENA